MYDSQVIFICLDNENIIKILNGYKMRQIVFNLMKLYFVIQFFKDMDKKNRKIKNQRFMRKNGNCNFRENINKVMQ